MFIFLGYRPGIGSGSTIVLGPSTGAGAGDIKYVYSIDSQV